MYEPIINDYVRWNKINGIKGWVYHKTDDYITIEINVTPKTAENYEHCRLHRNDRTLVICYHSQWNELEYVESRHCYNESDQSVL